jgi:probable rRNA maturation factor
VKGGRNPARVPVQLIVEAGPYPGIAHADVVRRVRAMLEALEMSKCEVSVLLTGDDQIQKLNRDYRGINRPTDVLAFSQREGELGETAGLLLGDVVVSVSTARRQASARARSVISEVTWLLAHGLLHLLGWDHDTPSNDRRMRLETERIFAAAETPRAARRRRR